MNEPDNLLSQMAGKTDDELQAMFTRPDGWLPEALEAARTELRRRGLDAGLLNLVPAAPDAGEDANVRRFLSFRQQAAIGIPFGVILQFLGHTVTTRVQDSSIGLFALLFYVVGLVLFIWGCVGYAKGKGYTKWLGALGLLSCLGLIVLVLLPDRRKEYDDHTS